MPLVAVVGATGAQGGAVVDALLRRGYSVRQVWSSTHPLEVV
jgi:uncharacterized protein YbjT (DUF2867 family)